jgi:hypothetical protein
MYYWILSDFTGGFDFFEENSCNLGWMGHNESMKNQRSTHFVKFQIFMAGVSVSAKNAAHVGAFIAPATFRNEANYEKPTNNNQF